MKQKGSGAIQVKQAQGSSLQANSGAKSGGPSGTGVFLPRHVNYNRPAPCPQPPQPPKKKGTSSLITNFFYILFNSGLLANPVSWDFSINELPFKLLLVMHFWTFPPFFIFFISLLFLWIHRDSVSSHMHSESIRPSTIHGWPNQICPLL